jgi:hypothetical protein
VWRTSDADEDEAMLTVATNRPSERPRRRALENRQIRLSQHRRP